MMRDGAINLIEGPLDIEKARLPSPWWQSFAATKHGKHTLSKTFDPLLRHLYTVRLQSFHDVGSL
jgi:hypothetical protein